MKWWLRLTQACLVLLIVSAGVYAWRRAPRPDPGILDEFAQAELASIFSDETTQRGIERDPAVGVTIRDLRVPTRFEGDAMVAREVFIEHDPLALAVGVYVPRSILISDARVPMSETETGFELDFPFELPGGEGEDSGDVPEIRVRDARLLLRSRVGSTRLAPGAVLSVAVDRLDLTPGFSGDLRVEGRIRPLGLGEQDAERIALEGRVNPATGAYSLAARWEGLRVTPQLLSLLAAELRQNLRDAGVREGNVTLGLEGEAGGASRMLVEFDGVLDLSTGNLPGTEALEAETRELLGDLFGEAVLDVETDGDRVAIRSLETRLGGGLLTASGHVEPESGALRMDFQIRDLSLEAPDVREALGPTGAEVFDQFHASGSVNATGTVMRSEGGELTWQVDVLLQRASFRFMGKIGEDGQREGFPYRVEDATGRLTIGPEGVVFGDIVGFNREVEIMVRGHEREAWTGGETGVIRFTEAGTEIHLTVEVHDMAVDERLEEAVAGSEFAGLLDEFQLGGVLDTVEVDIVRLPGVDEAAQTEVRVTLEGETFQYAPFPLLLDDVRGTIERRREVLPEGGRAKRYVFDVTGWSEGSSIAVIGAIDERIGRGQVEVRADGLPLDGAVTEAILEAPLTQGSLVAVWQWLDPRGRADILATLPLGKNNDDPLTLRADLKSATIHLDALTSEYPLRLEELVGPLAVRGDDFTLTDIRGKLGDADIRVNGFMHGGIEGTWDLDIQSGALTFTDEVLAGLRHLSGDDSLLPEGFWLEPGSRSAFDLRLMRAPGAASGLETAVLLREMDGQVRTARGDVIDVRATQLSFDGDYAEVIEFEADIPGLSVVVPEARIPLGQQAGAQDDLTGRFTLVMDAWRLDPDLLTLVSPATAEALTDWLGDRLLTSKALSVAAPRDGPIRLEGDLSVVVPEGRGIDEGPRGTLLVAPLVLERDAEGISALRGRVVFDGFSMDAGPGLRGLEGQIEISELRLRGARSGRAHIRGLSGRVADVRFDALDAPLVWADEALTADDIRARVARGTLRARAAVSTREPMAYEGALVLTDFDVKALAQDIAPTGAPVSGQGQLRFEFQNRGGDIGDLTGAGTLQVRQGSLGELPGVANIFALLADIFDNPNPPQFERADVRFRLAEEMITFDQLDLAGPLFEMPGTGTMDLGGQVDLTFTPDFIKSLALPGLLQLPGAGDVVGALLREEFLYAIKLRGDIDAAKPEIVPFPWLQVQIGTPFEGTPPQSLPPRRVPTWFR